MTGAECAAQPRAALEVLRTGPLALIEDLGRAGLAHIGVTRSGAADRRSHTLANRLVANPGDRATIEVTFGGFSARVRGGDVAIAVTGADTDPSVNGKPFGTNSIQFAHDGQVISLGAPHSGLRTYLAVRGGIDVSPVLGSRSYDVMSAIGPLPLQPGDVLPVGEHTDEQRDAVSQRKQADVLDDVLQFVEEENDAHEEHEVVVPGHHMLGAKVEEGANRGAVNQLQEPGVAFRHAVREGGGGQAHDQRNGDRDNRCETSSNHF